MSPIRRTIALALCAMSVALLVSNTQAAVAEDSARNSPVVPADRDFDRGAGERGVPRHPVDIWEPTPTLPPQTAPDAPILQLSNNVWTSIGPTPLAVASPANPNSNVSGRITGIAADPTDANVIYIATAGGGLTSRTGAVSLRAHSHHAASAWRTTDSASARTRGSCRGRVSTRPHTL